jgi:hypothetical protein
VGVRSRRLIFAQEHEYIGLRRDDVEIVAFRLVAVQSELETPASDLRQGAARERPAAGAAPPSWLWRTTPSVYYFSVAQQ